jgi:hypothetical protein
MMDMGTSQLIRNHLRRLKDGGDSTRRELDEENALQQITVTADGKCTNLTQSCSIMI